MKRINRFINECLLERTSKTDIELLEEIIKIIGSEKIEITHYNISVLFEENSKLVELIKQIVADNKTLIDSGDFSKQNKAEVNLLIEFYNIEIFCIEQMEKDGNLMHFPLDSLSMYLQDLSKKTPLSRSETELIFQKIALNDEEARNKLIEHNLRLVFSVAKKYCTKSSDFLDLVQEGNIGLMKAIDKFDVNRGFLFSTYAYYWIDNRVRLYASSLNKGLKVAQRHKTKLELLTRVEAEFLEENGYNASLEEICRLTKFNSNTVLNLRRFAGFSLSLESTVPWFEEEKGMLDSIKSSDDVESSVVNSDFNERIRKLLEEINLTEQEKTVVLKRFGFDGKDPETLEQIASLLKIKRERVRQILEKALYKLRINKKTQEFSLFLNNPIKAREYAKAQAKIYRASLDEENISSRDLRSKIKGQKSNSCGEVNHRFSKTVYEEFSLYEKEVIDLVVRLNYEFKKDDLLKRYGEDLSVANSGSQLSVYDSNLVYTRVHLFLKKELELHAQDPLNYMPKKERDLQPKIFTIYDDFDQYDNSLLDEVLKHIVPLRQEQFLLYYGSDFSVPNYNRPDSLNLRISLRAFIKHSLDDYLVDSINFASKCRKRESFIRSKNKEIIEKGLLNKYMEKEELEIVCLTLGIHSKIYSISEATLILGIDEDKIRLVTLKALILVRRITNNLTIDENDINLEQYLRKLC